jgi:SAM-dependent methyltransferase
VKPTAACLLLALAFACGRNPPPPPPPADPNAPKPVSKKPAEHDTAGTKTAFTDIYKDSTWGSGADGGLGTSGTGSTLSATLLYRTYLQQFLKENEIKSVVDAGCGDWEFSQTIDWSGVDYTGYDIVQEVVDANTKKFAKPNIKFVQADIVQTDLAPADLLISKHVLQHLPNTSVQKFITQLGKYKHVLLINGVDPKTFSGENRDIGPGDYRFLDVTEPPFNLKGKKVLTYLGDDGHMHQVVHITR